MALIRVDAEPARSLMRPVGRVGACHARLSEAADCRGSFLG